MVENEQNEPRIVGEETKDQGQPESAPPADIDFTKLTDDELEELVGEKISLVKQRQA